MSTPTRPQLNAEKSLGGYTQRHARKLYIGELGNNSGVVDDTARTTSGQDFVFVRLNQDANQVISALAATSFPHVADIIVVLELVERKGAPYYQVLGIAPNIVYSTATATWSGVPGAHANQHERRDRNAGGFDPLDVYTRALVNLRARAQTTPDLTLHVERGFYIFSSVKEYAGGNSPAFVPPATLSSQRWDLLYLGSDDALHITSGVATSGFGTPVYPTCPVDAIPLAYVILRTAQTSILEADITDARVLWTATQPGDALGWFNVMDPAYGAVGDGAADDGPAFQLANDAAEAAGGGIVYYPTTAAGYRVATTTTIDGQKRITHLFEPGSMIYPDASTTVFVVHQGSGGGAANKRVVSFEGPRIDGQSRAGTVGIEVQDTDWTIIRDYYLVNLVVPVWLHCVTEQVEGSQIDNGIANCTGADSCIKLTADGGSWASFAETHIHDAELDSGANGAIYLGANALMGRSLIEATFWPRENEICMQFAGDMTGCRIHAAVDMGARNKALITAIKIPASGSGGDKAWIDLDVEGTTIPPLPYATLFNLATNKKLNCMVQGNNLTVDAAGGFWVWQAGESYPRVAFGPTFLAGGGIGFGDGSAAPDGSLCRLGAGWLGSTVPFGLKTYATAGRPTAVGREGALIYDSDLNTVLQSDGATWNTIGGGVTDHGALTGLVPDDDHTQYQLRTEKSAASGYASLDGTTKVPTAELGTGVANSTKFLRGDRAWSAAPAGSDWSVLTDGASNFIFADGDVIMTEVLP